MFGCIVKYELVMMEMKIRKQKGYANPLPILSLEYFEVLLQKYLNDKDWEEGGWRVVLKKK